MNNDLTKAWTVTLMVLLAAGAYLLPDAALADDTIFTSAQDVVGYGFAGTRKVAGIVGGLGAIGLGVMAFFGRFRWSWFFALVGGLGVIFLATEFIGWLDTTSGAKTGVQGVIDGYK